VVKCSKCGGSKIERGTLTSFGHVGTTQPTMFRSDKEKLTHDMKTHVFAIACMDCGILNT
jgi:hypothetical protein